MATKYTFYPESTRGEADYGWLKAKYSFSFGQFYDPEREQFGKLRVLNDDIVQPGEGFGTHPHRNMEIVTIPLSGKLAHKDSLGHESVINTGEVQVMSAGSGIQHSEYNASDTAIVNILQLWVFPNKANVDPRYDQKSYDFTNKNEWVNLVKPFDKKDDKTLWVYQDSYFSMATITSDNKLKYTLNATHHVAYIFVIEGSVVVENYELTKKDALGVETLEPILIQAKSESKVLLVEVPK